jgi:hypothetical protein
MAGELLDLAAGSCQSYRHREAVINANGNGGSRRLIDGEEGPDLSAAKERESSIPGSLGPSGSRLEGSRGSGEPEWDRRIWGKIYQIFWAARQSGGASGEDGGRRSRRG